MSEVECVVDCQNNHGEGPAWSVDEQKLYWLDIQSSELWRYDPATAGLRFLLWPLPRFSRDGSTIYVPAYHEDGLAGVWAIPVEAGEPSLAVEIPDLWTGIWLSVGPDRLYVTVGENQSDIRVMDVAW